jgi:hypothetical protein
MPLTDTTDVDNYFNFMGRMIDLLLQMAVFIIFQGMKLALIEFI